MIRRINGKVRTGITILFILCITAILAEQLAPCDPYVLGTPYLRPSADHLLGTNDIGQDIFSELIYGTRISLLIGVASAVMITGIGTILGILSGYLGGRIEQGIMHATSIAMSIPSLPLTVILVAFMNAGICNIIIAICVTSWTSTARIIRSRVQQIREMPFVKAEQTMGAGKVYIMVRHIFPNILDIVLLRGVMSVGDAMLMEASLSFLGLGVVGQKSWGGILHYAFFRNAIIKGLYWWYLPPVLCISLSVLGFVLLSYYGQEPAEKKFGATLSKVKRYSRTLRKEKENFFEREELETEGVSVRFGNQPEVLQDIWLKVNTGEKVAVIGETGSGKSVLLLSILRMLSDRARVEGRIFFRGRDLLEMPEKKMYTIRGVEIAYVPQGSGNGLNPLYTIGHQMQEAVQRSRKYTRGQLRGQAEFLLERFGMENVMDVCRKYPFQISGGMRQRVLIAMGIAADAGLVLADEPTKGLDQSHIEIVIDAFQKLKEQTVLCVTHDLRFAKAISTQIVVMYASQEIESGDSQTFFEDPLHPYSKAMLEALPENGLQISMGFAPPREDERAQEGCHFCERCSWRQERCRTAPPMISYHGRKVRCWKYVD